MARRSPYRRARAIHALTTCLCAAVCGWASAQPNWSVAKGTDSKGRVEDGSIGYVADAQKGESYSLQLALLRKPRVTFGGTHAAEPATLSYAWGVGVSKDTVSGNESDKLTAAFWLQHVLTLAIGDAGRSTMHTDLTPQYRRNRRTNANEAGLVLTSRFNLRGLKWMNSGSKTGDALFKAVVQPLAGLYYADVRGGKAPNGRYAAPFAGLDVDFRMWPFEGSASKPWFSIEASIVHQPEHEVTGDFRSANYDWGKVAVKIPVLISGDPDLKTSISLIHTRGTYRIDGTPWKRQTVLAFTLNYALDKPV